MSGNAFPPRPHLTTPRLTLNALTPADCEETTPPCAGMPGATAGGATTTGRSSPIPRRSGSCRRRRRTTPPGGSWALRCGSGAGASGEVAITHFDGHGTAELGCRIAAAYAGHGYGTEAFAAALGVGPEGLGSAAA